MRWTPDAHALRGRVAVVAGATRGAGRGIAAALGEAGATVFCTGRSTRALGSSRSDYQRPEVIEETAELVSRLGGHGIPVAVDHLVPARSRRACRSDPEHIRAHRCARQRHLGSRGPQGRTDRVEYAGVEPRPRQRTAHPAARHRHAHHHRALPAPAADCQPWRIAGRGHRRDLRGTTTRTTASRCSTTWSRRP